MKQNNRKMEIYRAGIARAVAILANQGVQVTQIGAGAYCQWNDAGHLQRINIPMIPDTDSSPLLNAIQGYVDHEVGHALFTDPLTIKAALKAAGSKSKEMKSLGNIVEDVRIEREMAAKYAGSQSNLDSTIDYVITAIWRPALEKATRNKNRKQIATVGLVPYLRALGGQPLLKKFCDQMGLSEVYRDLDDAMPDLPARLAAMASTEDAYVLAADIMKVLKNPPPPPQEEPPQENEPDAQPQGQSGDGDDQGDASDDASGDEAGDSDGSDQGDDGEGEGQESDDDGEGQGAGGADQGDGEGEGEGPSDSTDGSGDEGKTQDEIDADTEAAKEKQKKAGAGIGDVEIEGLVDMDDMMAGEITKSIRGSMANEGVINLTDNFDLIQPFEKLSEFKASADFSRLDRKIDPLVHPMVKTLQRLLVARSRSQLIGGFTTGRINSPALHRYGTGATELFRRRVESKGKEVAISLLIDNSGSMNQASGPTSRVSGQPTPTNSKLTLATEAAYAFSAALTKLKISHEIIGFTTSKQGNSGLSTAKYAEQDAMLTAARNKMASDLKVPSGRIRFRPVIMPIYKSFDEGFTALVKRRFASMLQTEPKLLSSNDDSTSIRIAANRLWKRPEPRKILIVLSDGEPAAALDREHHFFEVKKVVKDLEREGMEVFGIGIMSAAVEKFYTHYQVINKIDELPAFVVGKLREMLLAKA